MSALIALILMVVTAIAIHANFGQKFVFWSFIAICVVPGVVVSFGGFQITISILYLLVSGLAWLIKKVTGSRRSRTPEVY